MFGQSAVLNVNSLIKLPWAEDYTERATQGRDEVFHIGDRKLLGSDMCTGDEGDGNRSARQEALAGGGVAAGFISSASIPRRPPELRAFFGRARRR